MQTYFFVGVKLGLNLTTFPSQIDMRQVIHALADALDLVGIDELHHGKRVAYMAWNCAQTLGWSQAWQDRLYHAALLHDCGVSSSEVHRQILSQLDGSNTQAHCRRGEQLLQLCPSLAPLAPIVRYHHSHWDELPSELSTETACMANLIYLCDRTDALMNRYEQGDILIAREDIRHTLQQYRGTLFAPHLLDAFLETAANELFWLTMENRHLLRYLQEMEQQPHPATVPASELRAIAAIFADIVDAKSHFTVEHSRGVARLARYLGELADVGQERLLMLETAGLLHDLGKLNIPDEILEKPGPLSAEEKAVMMRHSFESYQILRRINGFENIAQWAAFHHEALSGQGYPFHKDHEKLSLEARIIAVADVLQALAQDRPYRDALPLEDISAILSDMACQGSLDPELVKQAQNHLQHCWQQAVGA